MCSHLTFRGDVHWEGLFSVVHLSVEGLGPLSWTHNLKIRLMNEGRYDEGLTLTLITL